MLPLFLLIIASYWTVKPLLSKGYFTMHDDTQVGRVIVMGRALRNGQFPVRWVSELGYGYGYPLFNFYGPLPYYVGGGLYAAGVDAIVATRMMMGVGMMLAAVFMYVLGQFLFGRFAGMLAAVLYAYAPYHAVQLYVRGAVGELWAYALLPLFILGVFLGGHRALRKGGAWIGGLGLAGVILSHTIMGYITVVFYGIGLVLYTVILLFKRQFHFSLLAIGLGLSAFFWLPAAAEMGYTNVAGQIGTTANFRDHFVCLPQLWNSLWGYGGSAPGCIDGMSLKIGKLHVLLGALGLVIATLRLKRDFWKHPLGLISAIGLGSTVMVTSFSQTAWEFLPGFAFVQYPWRFLTGIAFAASLLGASVLLWVSHRWVRVIALTIFILVTILLNAKLFVPQITYDKPESFFESEEELSWRVSKVSDEYLSGAFLRPQQPRGVARGILVSDKNRGLAVETEIDSGIYAKLHVQVPSSMEVTLARGYFPGWRYWVNGVRQNARIENGLPVITVPAGGSVMEMRFSDTPVRVIGNILSILVGLWFLKAYGKKSIT